MAGESGREARRRKILDRGVDRLAFITGQAPSSLRPSTVASPPPPPPPNRGWGEIEEPVPDTVGDNVAPDLELPKCEPSSAAVRDMVDRNAGVAAFPECGKSDEAADTMQHNNEKVEPLTVHSTHNQVVNSEPQHGNKPTLGMFTAKRISSAISASENIRMLCAASVALIVLLSYHGYPVGGELIGSIISFRPIFLVLLSDAALMFGILFTTSWKKKGEAYAERTGQESDDWTNQMSKALEVVLVLQKLGSAAFLDCCLCVVIIICGISFSTIP